MGKSKLCMTVAAAIAGAGLLFASSAWCAGAVLSKVLYAQGCVEDGSEGNFLFFYAQLDAMHPDSDSIFVSAYSAAPGSLCQLGAQGNQLLWGCSAQGSAVDSLLNLKINPQLTTVNFDLDLTQPAFDCSPSPSTPPAAVQIACADSGYFNRSVENGTLQYPSAHSPVSSVHSDSIYYQASCTAAADSETFGASMGATLAYSHFVQTGP